MNLRRKNKVGVAPRKDKKQLLPCTIYNLEIVPTHCSSSNCIEKLGDVLICTECSHSVNLQCSQLPAYFLHLVISKKELYPYVYISCVNVPKDLIEKVNDNLKNNLDHLKHEIKAFRQTVYNHARHVTTRQKESASLTSSLCSTPSSIVLSEEKKVANRSGLQLNDV